MKADYMVFVAVHYAVFTDCSAGRHITSQATIEVGHGIRVFLGDGEQTLSLPLCHVQSDSIAIFFVTCKTMQRVRLPKRGNVYATQDIMIYSSLIQV